MQTSKWRLVAPLVLALSVTVFIGCGEDEQHGPGPSPRPNTLANPSANGPQIQNQTPGQPGQPLPGNPSITLNDSGNPIRPGEVLPELPIGPEFKENERGANDAIFESKCVRTKQPLHGPKYEFDHSSRTHIVFDRGRVKLIREIFKDENCANNSRSDMNRTVTLEIQAGGSPVWLFESPNSSTPEMSGSLKGSLEFTQHQILLSFDDPQLAAIARAQNFCGLDSWNPRTFYNVSGLVCTSPDIIVLSDVSFGPKVQLRGTVYTSQLTLTSQTPLVAPENIREGLTLSPIIAQSPAFILDRRTGKPARAYLSDKLSLFREYYNPPAQVEIKTQSDGSAPKTGNQCPLKVSGAGNNCFGLGGK